MTVAMLMENTHLSATRFFKELNSPKRTITPLSLKLKTPVPSDIDIAMSQTPKLITDLSKELGLTVSELEPYGPTKAKVSLDVLKRLGHRKDGNYIVVAG